MVVKLAERIAGWVSRQQFERACGGGGVLVPRDGLSQILHFDPFWLVVMGLLSLLFDAHAVWLLC